MKPVRRPHPPHPAAFTLFSHSLSARVLWLTVAIILLVELVILMPSLGRARETWLWNHITSAHLAAYSAGSMFDGTLDPATQSALLRLSGTQSIKLTEAGKIALIVAPAQPVPAGLLVSLDDETLLCSTWRAGLMVLGLGPREIEVTASSPLRPDTVLDIVVSGHRLTMALRSYTAHIAALSLIVGLVTGLLVFAALDRLLVRPMRIITASIARFRQDPEQDGQSDLAWLAARRNDEISQAARELKAMQDEMRAALWRNARLAAVGTSVAKISHDLRNILSSALLVADRLQETSDPVAQRAARTLIPAVEHAAQLVSRTVDFAREGPPAITRSAVSVRDLVDEAALVVRPDDTGITIENRTPDALVLPLDRAQIYRVLVNLLRNAVEAGADRITLSVDNENGVTRMKVSDNGSGLPLRRSE